MSTSLLTKLDFISETEIVKKASEIGGFSVTRHNHGGWMTSNVGEYLLDGDLLKSLEKVNFTLEPGKDAIRQGCIYLAGHSNQRGNDTFETDCWMCGTRKIKIVAWQFHSICLCQKKNGVWRRFHMCGEIVVVGHVISRR